MRRIWDDARYNLSVAIGGKLPVISGILWTGLPQRPCGRGHLDAKGFLWRSDLDACHTKTSSQARLLLLRGGLSFAQSSLVTEYNII